VKGDVEKLKALETALKNTNGIFSVSLGITAAEI
jgi:hypothetical protein